MSKGPRKRKTTGFHKRALRGREAYEESRIAEYAASPVKTYKMCMDPECDGSCGDYHRKERSQASF